MPTSIIHGKYLLTEAGTGPDASDIFGDAAIFQCDSVIEDVGPYAEIKSKYKADEEIGGNGHLVLPGLVNAHHHGMGLTMYQLGLEDDCLETYLVQAFGLPNYTDHYNVNLFTALQMIKSGTTSILFNATPMPGPNIEQEISVILDAFGDAGMRCAYAMFHRHKNQFFYADDEIFIRGLQEELANILRSFHDPFSGGFSDDDYFSLLDSLREKYLAKPDHRYSVMPSPGNLH